MPERIVIVGGGRAGISAAVELRGRGYTGALTVVDAGEFPHDRPPLSKGFLMGDAAVRLVPEGWFDEHDVRLCAGRSAVALRPGQGAVELDDGRVLAADAVLLATGGAARRLPVPGGDSPGVHVLRTVDDARGLRAALVPGARVVVVGGGLIGAEVASSAVALGCAVTLVEPVPLPLEGAVGREIAALLHGQHAAAGIRVLTDSVAAVTSSSRGLAVVTGSGDVVGAEVVVAGIGMTVPADLARGAGLEVDGGVVVDAAHRTSRAGVFAAGDGARVRGRLRRSEHWQAAQRGGEAAAAAMLGLPAPDPEPEWFWSDRHGVHAEAVGSMAGPHQVVRGEPGRTPLTVFTLDAAGRVLGAAAVDDPRSIAAARRLIRAAAPPDPDALADVTVDPRRLVRR